MVGMKDDDRPIHQPELVQGGKNTPDLCVGCHHVGIVLLELPRLLYFGAEESAWLFVRTEVVHPEKEGLAALLADPADRAIADLIVRSVGVGSDSIQDELEHLLALIAEPFPVCAFFRRVRGADGCREGL